MAKTSLINKQRSAPKFKARTYTRCRMCGRPARVPAQVPAVPDLLPKPGLRGEIPGVAKASW